MMGLVFLILFALAEITLVVLTFTKFGEKVKWLNNRLIVRGAEAALLTGMVLLPTTYLKWRFFGALIVLVIRFLFAGIMWLIRRKKAQGMKKKAGTVVNCIVSLLLVGFMLVPSFIFANYNGLPTTGEFKVKETSAILVDEGRLDEFENDGSFREVPAHFYYPDAEGGSYPLVMFSHGAFGSDGKTVTVDQEFINSAMNIGGGDDEQVYEVTSSWMKLRVDDGNFVLDTIKEAKDSGSLGSAWHTEDATNVQSVIAMTDTGKIGYMGHSLGGATGVALGRVRKDISAVIDLDGTALGEIVGIRDGKCVCIDEPYPVPVLVLSQEMNGDEEGAYANVTENMIDLAKDGKLATFHGAGHMDFTDLPLFSPVLGSMFGHGDVNSEEFLTNVNGIVLNWFNYYLKNEGTVTVQAQY